jgi:hypothetical protein
MTHGPRHCSILLIEEPLRIAFTGRERHCDTTLSPFNTIALHSKISLLTMTYEIAYEEYSIHVSWLDCCTEATKRLHATVVPKTVTVWNRIFRTVETFPHRHEDEKSSKPFVFRNYPTSETIARSQMRLLKKTEKLSCETAAAFLFGGKFIDLVLEKEYKEEWEFMEEDDRAFARQDFLLENHLKEKSNPQTASNWLAYLGFEYGPFI